MPLNLAVIGRTGQLAQALNVQARTAGHNCVFYDRKDCDLSQTSSEIETFVRNIPKPDALIIAAAYTNVDGAEANPETAYAVNAHATTAIAKICAERDIPLVHISTDCVFDGSASTPYLPDTAANPINIYGASKRAGEQGILNSGANAAILRTSWIYGGTAKNFLGIMLGLGQTRRDIRVVSDQFARPIYAPHLADAVLQTAQGLYEGKACTGVFHVTGSGAAISRAEFAEAIFKVSRSLLPHRVHVTPIPSCEYPTPATRPKYGVLDIRDFERVYGRALPAWDDGLEQACKDWFMKAGAK